MIEQKKVEYVKKEDMKIDYASNPQGTAIPEFPSFITVLTDGNFKVEMRKITNIKNKYDYFIIEDIKGRKLKQLYDRAKGPNGEIVSNKLQDLLIQNAIIYPIMTEDSIDDLNSSEVLRLSKAVNVIYDVESFI